MKFIFIVQGEGRGHLTQAIALRCILHNNDHQVLSIIVGKSSNRKIPAFFYEKIGTPVTEVDSPNFVTDKQRKSVKPFRTIVKSLINSPVYRKSIREIETIVNEHDPDVIVNFYDFLGGLYNFFHQPRAKFICVAHQYLISHKAFEFPSGKKLDQYSLRVANRITRLGADKILALSFQPLDDDGKKNHFVVPPLLRAEIEQLKVDDKGHLLVYIVNPGYSKEVEKFHQLCPNIPMHCFWDKKDQPDELVIDETLTFHQLNDKKFLDYMASARGFVTTAGFESVCEAMYLGKPVMMVPVDGHFEQACNAVDGEKAGAGIGANRFDITKLVEYLPEYQNTSKWFKEWAGQSDEMFLTELTT
ncbi:MAG: glycosyl transferase [Cyclobacteriaceae bacterium]